MKPYETNHKGVKNEFFAGAFTQKTYLKTLFGEYSEVADTVVFGLTSKACFFKFPYTHRIHVWHTLQGINISHLGKRKIIFKTPFLGDMLVPWRVFTYIWLIVYGKCR